MRGTFFNWELKNIYKTYTINEVITIINHIPKAIASNIPLEGCFLVSGSNVDAPIYKNSQVKIARIMTSNFCGTKRAEVTISPITGANASNTRNIRTIFFCCLFFSIMMTVFIPSVKSCAMTAKATINQIAKLIWNDAPIATPSKKLWRIRLPAPIGPMICPCSSCESSSSCVAKNLSKKLYRKKEQTTTIITYLIGKLICLDNSMLSGSKSRNATVTRLPAAKAKK